MRFYIVLALLLMLLVTIFAVQNNAAITITFLFWQIGGSLALVLMITLMLGILIGLLLLTPTVLRGKRREVELRRRLRAAEEEKPPVAAQAEEVSADRSPAHAEEASPEKGTAGGT